MGRRPGLPRPALWKLASIRPAADLPPACAALVGGRQGVPLLLHAGRVGGRAPPRYRAASAAGLLGTVPQDRERRVRPPRENRIVRNPVTNSRCADRLPRYCAWNGYI